MSNDILRSDDYRDLVIQLKEKVHRAQIKAALKVNAELIGLYWDIGRTISERQHASNWGDNVIGRIAKDLTRELGGLKGFSRANLYRMKQFHAFYQGQSEIVAQLVRQIPWDHNVLIIERIKDREQALRYVRQTAENGWSRDQLSFQLANRLYERQAGRRKADNFDQTLSAPQGALVRGNLKDSYVLDFLDLGKDTRERALEDALVNDIIRFMLELGKGFAFVGKQFKLEVGREEFFIDLLFYHLHLRCYVAIELKTGKSRPADIGQLNFYLTALDEQVRHPQDAPSIGMLFCTGKDATVVEYALKGANKPIHVPIYELSEELRKNLPTEQEINAQMRKIADQKP